MNDDLFHNRAFEPFYENFEGPVRSGVSAVRYTFQQPTPRQLLRRFWRQSIVPQPPKLCVPVECPPLKEFSIDPAIIEHMTKPL